jgi:2-deoxy-D-gluconate 3-dehydrogenase
LAFARAGADVVLNFLSREAEARSVEQQVLALGRRCVCVQADVSNQKDVLRLVAAAGQVDILVNNAGIIRRRPAVQHSDEEWDAVIEVNLSNAFRMCRAMGKHLIETQRPGKIINVASLLSFQGGITVPGYAAAKGGIVQLTKALANEWASHGINVNAIAPGYMQTDNTKALREDPQRNKQITERIPAGRWGTPEDVGGAAVFLASSASDYVHGHVLVVDGGWMGR